MSAEDEEDELPGYPPPSQSQRTSKTEARMSTPSLLQLKDGVGFRYVMGIDHARTGRDGEPLEDLGIVIVMVHDARGERRIEMVSLLDRRDEKGALMQHYTLTKGWQCPACNVFCGEEKEPMLECRNCEAKRPGP